MSTRAGLYGIWSAKRCRWIGPSDLSKSQFVDKSLAGSLLAWTDRYLAEKAVTGIAALLGEPVGEFAAMRIDDEP